MEGQYDDFSHGAQKASNKGKFTKLARYQKNVKYNFDGLYSYNTKKTHLDLPGTTMVKLAKWSQTSTTHYTYARRLLENNCGFQEWMSD